MLAQKINATLENFQKEISTPLNLKVLDEIRIKYLSKNGIIPSLFDELKSSPKEERPNLGKLLNSLRDLTTTKIAELKEQLDLQLQKDKAQIDLSLPGRIKLLGSKHLLTQTLNEIKSIFRSLGFSSIDGPELESDYYNFEALNFPKDHPARDMQDTFFVSKDFLLRTHTTPVQVRIMEKHQPPVRAIMPGRVYRNEAVSARSYCMFHQVDGIYVDTDVTFAELKGTLVAFAKQFYMEDLKYRFRPSFFPFTEPSAEMDITCYLCHGKGCKVCKYSGWLEILGCGMVDPNVFKMVGYDPEKYSGYAFGMGIERTAMLKYGITDIRIFFDNDVRFLKQF
ncbi:MAG: phenylalanine--tRNA ligase subunit alpha [Ignavibacteriaceae bacterium]|nr:phenylalanine--tRNA ligase subunit alpha [Ignavibacteriaceae bacterium]